MKRLAWLALWACLVPLALTACGDKSNELIITSEVPTSHWKNDYIREFADLVKKKTNGKIEVKFYPAGQLYTDHDALAALGTGSVQMVWPVTSQLDTFDRRMEVSHLPFAVTDELMLKDGFIKDLANFTSSFVEDQDLKVLTLLRSSNSLLLFRDKKVRDVQDIEGLKMRVAGETQMRLFRRYGASPVSMAASELGPAMSQGVIDGVVTSPAGWHSLLSGIAHAGIRIPNLSLTTYAVVVDNEWFEGLDPDIREAVASSVREVAKDEWRQSMKEGKTEVQDMIEAGNDFWQANPEQAAEWEQRAQPIIDEFADKYPDAMKRFRAIRAKYE